MTKKQNKTSINKRASILLKIFLFGILIVVIRAAWLQLAPPSGKTQEIAKNQYRSKVVLTPYRGTIFDHKKNPLAISINTPSIAMNPKIFKPNKKQLNKLAKLLGLSKKRIKKLAKRDSYFAWLKRKVHNETAAEIKSLSIKGLHFILEPARYYPNSKHAAHLLGYVGLDHTGLLGIEQKMNKTLSGTSSKSITLKDGRGSLIFSSQNTRIIEEPGNNIVLTIDNAIQQITEEALEKWYLNSKAKSAFAIVSDPHTGRILAVANQPGFDPNDRKNFKFSRTKNYALSALFEPGSVVKPFVVAAALEKGLVSLYEIHDCEKNGRYKVSKNLFIRDDHPKEFQTTEEILINSSNICTFKLAKKLGKEGLYQSLKLFGFANKKQMVKFQGRHGGVISPYQKWSEIRFSNISFGQGFLSTGLEVVQSFASIANGGYLIEPYLVEKIESPTGETIRSFSQRGKLRVLSNKTSEILRNSLEKVVTEGTGKNAFSKVYSMAGKTGTSEKIDPVTKAYSKNLRIASFAGFAPATDPHLVAYVVIDEPGMKPYYGGKWAAPAFKEILENSLKYLNISTESNSLVIKSEHEKSQANNIKRHRKSATR